MKKIIIIVLICMISYVYADTSNDCDTVVSAEFSEYTSILPVSDFAIAKSHILAYCCKEKLSSFADSGYREKYCKDLPSVYPESPFWYDHLVDVGFRRLDVV
ncbi:TPA: hypothetical protein DEP21_05750 [Patescibacteria group bacterium]|nr:hypothetical protein [Candidatus Gracilibacteria bacterium]